jgi:predicted RNA-binding protein YlxR (DUF448 family)
VTDQGAAGDRKGPSGRAIADLDATMPGRGAYLCRDGDLDASRADPACLARAVHSGGIARALRAAVSLDPKLVESP